MAEKMMRPSLSSSGKSKIVFIHGDDEPHADLARGYEITCNREGWQYMSFTHPGGHHFPQNWDVRRSQVMRFLND